MQAQPPCCYSIQLCPRFAGLPTFCKLVLNYNAVDLAGKGGASIQRNDAIAIIGRKIGLVVKFAAIVVVMGMTERAMPMTADNGFPGFGDTAVGSLHTVDPPGLVPLLSACVAPICDRYILSFVTTYADWRAGNPSVSEDIMVSFIIINHCRNNGLDIGIFAKKLYPLPLAW